MADNRCRHVTPEHQAVTVEFVGGHMVATEDSRTVPAKRCRRKRRNGRAGVVHLYCALHEAAGMLAEDGAELIESTYFISEPAP